MLRECLFCLRGLWWGLLRCGQPSYPFWLFSSSHPCFSPLQPTTPHTVPELQGSLVPSLLCFAERTETSDRKEWNRVCWARNGRDKIAWFPRPGFFLGTRWCQPHFTEKRSSRYESILPDHNEKNGVRGWVPSIFSSPKTLHQECLELRLTQIFLSIAFGYPWVLKISLSSWRSSQKGGH